MRILLFVLFCSVPLCSALFCFILLLSPPTVTTWQTTACVIDTWMIVCLRIHFFLLNADSWDSEIIHNIMSKFGRRGIQVSTYHSESQSFEALKSSTCPSPEPAPASVIMTGMSSENPKLSPVPASSSEPIGMRALSKAVATLSPTRLKKKI